jgi:uncharacterized protein (UPF0333 family)
MKSVLIKTLATSAFFLVSAANAASVTLETQSALVSAENVLTSKDYASQVAQNEASSSMDSIVGLVSNDNVLTSRNYSQSLSKSLQGNKTTFNRVAISSDGIYVPVSYKVSE